MLTHRSNTFFLLSGLITWAIIRFFYPVSGIFPVILLMLWLLMATVGSFTIRMNYHLEGYHENPASADIALTFDDGPTEYTVQVLDLLQTYRAKATFFLIGRQAEKYPELVRRMLAEGHTVGNHTWSHSPRTGFMRAGEMEKEIRAADRILESWVRGKVKFYRPPFGVTNPSVRKAVQATGHALMGWSVRSLDTVIRDERKIVKRILRMLRPGSVILLHDTSQKSVNVLRELLEELENRSLRPVTLDQLFDIHAYEKI